MMMSCLKKYMENNSGPLHNFSLSLVDHGDCEELDEALTPLWSAALHARSMRFYVFPREVIDGGHRAMYNLKEFGAEMVIFNDPV